MGQDFAYVNSDEKVTNEENTNIKTTIYENKENGIYTSGVYIDTYGED